MNPNDQNPATANSRAARWSTLTYTAISLAVALGFLALATAQGMYTDVARFGGAAWVFVLSLIITMPLVTSWYKQRARR